MMTFEQFGQKVRRKLLKIRLHPIRVFCFHQVSDEFDPDTMLECDWITTDAFKRIVLSLKEKYSFISLQEAYRHIDNDRFRMEHYAVLTADDGWASMKNILPWLAEQQIPITLFLNPLYMDGEHFRERQTERFLTEEDVKRITERYPNVSIGMHGWEHINVTKQNENDFRENVELSIQALKGFESFVPFFAYPWGRYNRMNKMVLREFGLIPVLMDGKKNYDDASSIHRELFGELY